MNADHQHPTDQADQPDAGLQARLDAAAQDYARLRYPGRLSDEVLHAGQSGLPGGLVRIAGASQMGRPLWRYAAVIAAALAAGMVIVAINASSIAPIGGVAGGGMGSGTGGATSETVVGGPAAHPGNPATEIGGGTAHGGDPRQTDGGMPDISVMPEGGGLAVGSGPADGGSDEVIDDTIASSINDTTEETADETTDEAIPTFAEMGVPSWSSMPSVTGLPSLASLASDEESGS